MPQTDPDTLKALSEAIDAYASAKTSNNESLVKFAIANLQQFLNSHSIVPNEPVTENLDELEN